MQCLTHAENLCCMAHIWVHRAQEPGCEVP